MSFRSKVRKLGHEVKGSDIEFAITPLMFELEHRSKAQNV